MRGDLPFRVQTDKPQFFPAAVDHVLDPQVELAAHDAGVWFAGELVEEVERDRVDLVVHVQAMHPA